MRIRFLPIDTLFAFEFKYFFFFFLKKNKVEINNYKTFD